MTGGEGDDVFAHQDLAWWFLLPTSLLFLILMRRHLRSNDSVSAFTQLEERVLESIAEGEIKEKVRKEMSPRRTIPQHIALSVVVFVASFIVAFWLSSGSL